MVGSLLVGRQIVDRAKIQRIIFEFDYYEKAFHQFYDTYRVVPGNVDYKTCRKYAEFVKADAVTTDGSVTGKLCDQSAPVNGPGSAKLLSPVFPQSKWMSTCWLRHAGLIEAYSYCRNWKDPSTGQTEWLSEGQVYAQADVNGRHYFVQTSFDSDVQLGYHGYGEVKYDASHIYDYKYNFQVFNFNPSDTYEVADKNFKNAVDRHNAMFMVNANLGCPCRTYSVNCACNKSVGAISAKMTSELDAKIDDGRPGTGRLLAYKNDYVHQGAKPSNTEIEKVCYNKPINQVSSAIYENSANMRYGCNIIKVMEDVK